MQFYKAPLRDYKFLIKDFLNSGSAESVLKNSDIELEDLDMILKGRYTIDGQFVNNDTEEV